MSGGTLLGPVVVKMGCQFDYFSNVSLQHSFVCVSRSGSDGLEAGCFTASVE